MKTAEQDMAAARQAADASAAADRREADDAAARRKGNHLWELRAKDANEPPFHYHNVPVGVVVVAGSEREARQHAAASGDEMAPAGFMMRETPMPDGAPAPKPDDPPRPMERVAVEARSPWLDEGLTTCEEMDLSEPRVVARAMGA
jgi:hypothetical protein